MFHALKAVARHAAVLAAVCAVFTGPATAAGPEKVLRYAFPVAATGFDPAQLSDRVFPRFSRIY